jgi:hypothetical protein
MTSASTAVKKGKKKQPKRKESSGIDTVLLHTPRPRPLQQQQQQQGPTMTTEQNYYIAFHSVIVVDMEKERKKKRTFQNVCRENQMFSLSRVCHGAHLQTQQQKKKMFLADEGKEKEKPDLASIQ